MRTPRRISRHLATAHDTLSKLCVCVCVCVFFLATPRNASRRLATIRDDSRKCVVLSRGFECFQVSCGTTTREISRHLKILIHIAIVNVGFLFLGVGQSRNVDLVCSQAVASSREQSRTVARLRRQMFARRLATPRTGIFTEFRDDLRVVATLRETSPQFAITNYDRKLSSHQPPLVLTSPRDDSRRVVRTRHT